MNDHVIQESRQLHMLSDTYLVVFFHRLISTDAAARGIDIQGVKCVVNYDAPQFIRTYIHRQVTIHVTLTNKAQPWLLHKDVTKYVKYVHSWKVKILLICCWVLKVVECLWLTIRSPTVTKRSPAVAYWFGLRAWNRRVRSPTSTSTAEVLLSKIPNPAL